MIAAVTLSIGLTSPSRVAAQDGDLPALDDMLRDSTRRITRTPSARSGAGDSPITAPSTERLQLSVQWGLRRAATEPEAQDRGFDAFYALVRDLGEPNRPLEATILLHEATAYREQGLAQVAQERIDQARRVAPDMPQVEFAQAELRFRESPASLFAWGSDLMRGWTLTWNQPGSRAAAQVNLLAVACAIGCVALLAMLLLILIRSLPLMASDLQRFVPRGVHRAQTGAALVLIFLIPLALFGSPLATLALILMWGMAYMSWSERLVALLLWVGLGALPLAAHHVDVGLQWAESDARAAYQTAFVACDADCREAVDAELRGDGEAAPDPAKLKLLDALRLLARDTAQLREDPMADTAALAERFQALSARGDLPPTLRVVALNNLGVTQAVLGEYDAALKAFAQGQKLEPQDFRSYVNTSRVYDLNKQQDAGAKALQRAVELGGQEAAAAAGVEDTSINRAFYIRSVPGPLFFKAHEATATETATPRRVWGAFAGDLIPLEGSLWVAILGLVALVVIVLAERRLRPARHCRRCDQPTPLGGHNPGGKSPGVCETCHLAFVENRLAYRPRVRHEERVAQFESSRVWMLRLGNVAFPGLGSAMLREWFGPLLMVVGSVGIGALLFWGEVLPDPWRLGGVLWFDGHGLLAGALLVIAVASSLGLIALGIPEDATHSSAPRPPSPKDESPFGPGG
ncbi:MAG: hypothetical protein CMH57_01025 [Myxococcales bacterium]|nr:hypothetical protein [Myxococcales bacterium]